MRPVLAALTLVACATGDDSGDYSALAERVDALETALDAETDRADSLETDLAAATTRIATLEQERDDLADDLAAVTVRVTGVESDVGVVETSVVALTADVGTLETSVGSLESDVGTLETDLGLLATDVGDLDIALTTGLGDLDLVEGYVNDLQIDVAAAQGGVDALQDDVGDVEGDVQALQGQWITEDTTWDIGPGGDFTSLGIAVAAMGDVRLMPEATLTLSLADGTHELFAQLFLDHPDGAQIELVGSSASAVTITGSGVRLTEGHAFGSISGVTIDGADAGGVGLWLTEQSRVQLDDVVLRDFAAGLRLEHGSSADADQLTATSNYVGIELGSLARLDGNTIDASGNGNTGLWVERGASVRASLLDVSDNVNTGVRIQTGAVVSASSLPATGNNVGADVSSGGVLLSISGDYGGVPAGTGVDVGWGSYAGLAFSGFTGSSVGIVAAENSVVDADETTFTDVDTEVSASTGSIVLGFP